MGKIGKALGYSMPSFGDEPSSDSEPDMADPGEADETDEVESAGPGKGEVIAMRAFMNADTAEAKASALKDFLELCDY